MKILSLQAIIISVVLCLVNCSCSKKSDIKSEKDLEGKIIGCQEGTTAESYLRNDFHLKIKTFKTGNDAALALKANEIDGVLFDELPAKEIVRQNSDLKIMGPLFEKEYYAIAVKKGNKALLDSINKTILKHISDGTFNTLMQSFSSSNGNILEPQRMNYEAEEILRMGTNAAFPPFEYTKGTEVVGFDVTLGKIIASDYNRRLQIFDMSFPSLIEALNSDSIDFIAAGMSITDERRKLVDFSVPYYVSQQVLIIRK